jgi:hypothetical protein
VISSGIEPAPYYYYYYYYYYHHYYRQVHWVGLRVFENGVLSLDPGELK